MSDIEKRIDKFRDNESKNARYFISGDSIEVDKIKDIGQNLHKLGTDALKPLLVEAYKALQFYSNNNWKSSSMSGNRWKAMIVGDCNEGTGIAGETARKAIKSIDERLKNDTTAKSFT